ncbi:helix-turn-helix transcriptional regulator [Pasteurella multocida]|uniref:Helix-turn-helix domain n=1 Tax=uncultured Avibacterium sp. TaxID=1936169 RepID=A0A486XDD5_9PAST|nr:helix-turn-helix transcriptional regulator [Pasteurella multocida]MEB3470137.1 helix-turn-helix transcriptional regulator [Pasteurella multocida]VGM96249.1 Helix-turn-helix domain [uncultured Avibacterium sp.]
MFETTNIRAEIGSRLKEEREKLKLNQEVMGAIGGVRKQAQLKYESGTSCPSADYLYEISKIGVDILYVVQGTRANTAISEEELLLLHKFRNADPAVRKFMLYGGESTAIGQNFEGEITGGQFGIINHYKE